MFPRVALAALVLVFANCSKNDQAQTPTPSVSADAPGKPADPASPPSSPSPAHKVPECERVAPKALMDKHCAGCVLSETKAPDGRGVSCRYKGDSIGGEFEIMLVCDKSLATKEIIDESLVQFQSMKTVKYERIEGLGKAAVKNGDLQVVFWDDDTPCQATITGVMVKVDFTALARDLVKSVTPAAIE